MPRSSRSSARPAPAGSRGAHTQARAPAAAPAPVAHQQQHQVPAQPHQQMPAQYQPQPKQPGMFAQMASTAAGVAVGSTVGHGISNMLFGGSGNSAPAPEAAAPPAPAAQSDSFSSYGQQGAGVSCETQSKDFVRCLESTNGDMTACGYYLEQLKACQAAARPY